MPAPRFKYLKPEDIRKLAAYEFAPRNVVEGYLAGRHRSFQRGPSSEFRDYRQYVAGDDPASLDWKVFARTDRYFVRTFDQETDTACYIFLDSSSSMGFGTETTKLEYASCFTAALSYLVTKSGNQVALGIFDNGIRSFLPLGGTGTHLRNIMATLEDNHPENETSVAEAMRNALPMTRRKGSIVVISDFFDDPGEIFAALSRFLHRGFKVYLFHILAPEETLLAPNTLRRFVDMETGAKLIVHPDTIRKQYNNAINAHIARIRAAAVRRGVEYSMSRTDSHYFTLFDKLVKAK